MQYHRIALHILVGLIAPALPLAGCEEPGDDLVMAPQETSMAINQQFDYARGGSIAGQANINVSLVDRSGKSRVDGGTVKVNGMELTGQHTASSGSILYYNGSFDPMSDSLKGPMAVFTVSGSKDFPALTDSIPFPHGPLRLVFTGGADTIPLNNEIGISWEPRLADTVTLTIMQEKDRFGERSFVQRTVYNGGGITIPSYQHRFIPGPVTITIRRNYFKMSTLPDGPRYHINNTMTNRFNDIILVR